MMFPRFLLSSGLSETSKLLYMVLLDRSRLSKTNPQWTDPQGRVFIRYSIQNLCQALGKGKTTISSCLNSLEKHNLIQRIRQGTGRANLIYVLLPGSSLSAASAIREKENAEIPESGIPDITRPEIRTPDDRFSEHPASGNAATINNYKSKNKRIRTMSENSRRPHGHYQNVFLSDAEITMLEKELPDWKRYAEQLSFYMKSTGKKYQNHAATIQSWANRDKEEEKTKKSWKNKDYSYKEGESL